VNLFGRPRLLSTADVGKARSMRASGYTLSQIAAALNVSIRTARRRFTTPYKQPERRW
jgi:hypothetical protein